MRSWYVECLLIDSHALVSQPLMTTGRAGGAVLRVPGTRT
jgi:hypothetical protein